MFLFKEPFVPKKEIVCFKAGTYKTTPLTLFFSVCSPSSTTSRERTVPWNRGDPTYSLCFSGAIGLPRRSKKPFPNFQCCKSWPHSRNMRPLPAGWGSPVRLQTWNVQPYPENAPAAT